MKNAKGSDDQPRDILDRTFEFAARVIRLCAKLDERPGVGRVLMSQILRAATSVPSNVEEAQAAQSKADFINKMSIALREARGSARNSPTPALARDRQHHPSSPARTFDQRGARNQARHWRDHRIHQARRCRLSGFLILNL